MFNYLKLKPNTLIKLNGVTSLKKIQNDFLISDLKNNNNNFLNLIIFQFQYNLINILLKIFKFLNLIWKKNLKASDHLSNYDIFNHTKKIIVLNNIWNTNRTINKNSFKKYFHIIPLFFINKKKNYLNNYVVTKNLNNGENLFKYFLHYKQKPRFKKYKKITYNFISDQLKNRRKLKKKPTVILFRHSRKKQRLIPVKTSYYYRYPVKLWAFFKWLKANSFLKPILFQQKFKKNFSYDKKLFNIKFFFKENYFEVPKKLKYKKIKNPLLNKKLLLYKTLSYNKKKKDIINY